MQKYITVLAVLTLAIGISRSGELPRTKSDRQEARPCFYAQADHPRPECGFQTDREGTEFDDMPGGPRAERQHLEKLRLSKLLELLDLSDDQLKEFSPLARESRNKHRRTIRKRERAVEKLGQLLKSDKTSDAEIQKLIDRISDLEKQRIKKQKDYMDRSRKILTPAQFGKLIVFQDRFERRMLCKLRGFRDRREEMRSRQGQPRSSTIEEEESFLIRNDSEQ